MAESEYETSLESLMAPQQQQMPQQMSQQMPQQMSQQMPQQMSQEQLEYQQQMQQQMQQQIQQQPFRPPSGGGKFIEKLGNINYQESLQSIIIIAILVMIFGNCYFKNLCSTLPFMCVVDGEFNIQSLIILGVLAGISYVFIKMYLI
jgi:hypothetical protein